MWAAGAREKGAAVAATGTQLRAFVRADPARCAWQLRCPQDLAVGPEGQSVQAPHWGGHTVPYCKSGWAVSLGLGPSFRIRGAPRGQFIVAVIYIGAESGTCVVCGRHGSEPAIHNALPEPQAQPSSPAPWSFPHTAEPGLWGALYRYRTALGACSPRLGEGAFPL